MGLVRMYSTGKYVISLTVVSGENRPTRELDWKTRFGARFPTPNRRAQLYNRELGA